MTLVCLHVVVPRCEIIRGGMETYLTPMGPTKLHVHPIFEIGPLQPHYSGEDNW
jgi:hypothetical protein